MAFDFKKEYKEFYLPKRTPELVSVPPMTFVAVRGEGDPNEPGGAYQAALGALNGKRIREDLVDTIFSRFCVGK